LILDFPPQPRTETITFGEYFSKKEHSRQLLYLCIDTFGLQDGADIFLLAKKILLEIDKHILRDEFPREFVLDVIRIAQAVRSHFLQNFSGNIRAEEYLTYNLTALAREARERLYKNLKAPLVVLDEELEELAA